MPSSEIISQLSDLNGAIQEDSLVLLSDTGHNNIYRYVKSGRIFAIKAVKPTCKDSELYRQFLYREYQLLSNLQSPFIVSVWQMTSLPEIGECMMMEYIDGRTLDRFVEERPSAALRRQVLDELLQAIDYLHRKQIVHADLKPQNILITNNGNHVKLIDLGLADSDSWRESNIGNTRQYAAPEQLQPEAELDQRTDIFALGHIVRTLFPLRYFLIVRRCLKANPNKRYQSVADLQKALQSHLSWWLLVALLVAVIAVFAIFYYKNFNNVAPSEQPQIKTISTPDTVVLPAQPTEEKQNSHNPQSDNCTTVADTIIAKDTVQTTNPIPHPEPVFDIEPIRQKATTQHEHLRDICLDSIHHMPQQYQEYANQIFLAYRDSSTAYMYREINRYPDHNMEIARIYDNADRHIFSPPVLKVINNLPSKAFADEHPDIQVPKSYQDVLDSIRNEAEMLYNRFADSITNTPYKYREYANYYMKRAGILAQYAEQNDTRHYPEQKGVIANIYSNAQIEFRHSVKPITTNYPSISEADSAMVWSLKLQLNEMHKHIFVTP